MKKRSICVAVAFLLVINLSVTFGVDAKASNTRSVNPNDYPINTKERYIASMACEKGITYTEAEMDLDSQNEIMPLASVDEIRYATVTKTATSFKSSKKTYNVKFSVEVKYVYDKTTKKKEIMSAGSPHSYVQGFSDGKFEHGGFNKKKVSGSQYRISATGCLVVENSVTFEAGGEFFSVGSQVNNNYTTDAKTGVIKIYLSDLK